VLRSPPSELKIDRKKDTLRNTECLIVLTCFSFVISRTSEVEIFCTFGLNSGCLITYCNSVPVLYRVLMCL